MKKFLYYVFAVIVFILAVHLIEYKGEDSMLNLAGNTIGAWTLMLMGIFYITNDEE